MKLKIRRSKRNFRFWLPLLLYSTAIVLILAASILSLRWNYLVNILFLIVPLYFTFNGYRITPDKRLNGNGTISIQRIQRIVKRADGGLDVYYVRMDGGRLRRRYYYPADDQFFIQKLTQINPHIQLN